MAAPGQPHCEIPQVPRNGLRRPGAPGEPKPVTTVTVHVDPKTANPLEGFRPPDVAASAKLPAPPASPGAGAVAAIGRTPPMPVDNQRLERTASRSLGAPSALHLPRFRPLASCRRRLLARVEASLWPASATLHRFGLVHRSKQPQPLEGARSNASSPAAYDAAGGMIDAAAEVHRGADERGDAAGGSRRPAVVGARSLSTTTDQKYCT
jgi:hypothetical protein